MGWGAVLPTEPRKRVLFGLGKEETSRRTNPGQPGVTGRKDTHLLGGHHMLWGTPRFEDSEEGGCQQGGVVKINASTIRKRKN